MFRICLQGGAPCTACTTCSNAGPRFETTSSTGYLTGDSEQPSRGGGGSGRDRFGPGSPTAGQGSPRVLGLGGHVQHRHQTPSRTSSERLSAEIVRGPNGLVDTTGRQTNRSSMGPDWIIAGADHGPSTGPRPLLAQRTAVQAPLQRSHSRGSTTVLPPLSPFTSRWSRRLADALNAEKSRDDAHGFADGVLRTDRPLLVAGTGRQRHRQRDPHVVDDLHLGREVLPTGWAVRRRSRGPRKPSCG